MAALTGKAALVTGGTRGIGAAIARRFAADGADVAFTYVSSAQNAEKVAEALRRHGGRVLAIRADSQDDAEVEQAVERTLTEFGRLDILVNNAGVYETGRIDELRREHFDSTVGVNLRAPFVASSRAARGMSEGGTILSIGSTFASRAPETGLSLYSMSKAALVGMTKGMARDLGPKGITVNIIHPGPTDTDMNPASGAGAEGQMASLPLGRFNEPDEVASLAAWLAGPDARNVTGAEFTIDGGANV